jgi:hypothetical protein
VSEKVDAHRKMKTRRGRKAVKMQAGRIRFIAAIFLLAG